MQALPWPDVDAWIDALSASPLVAVDDDDAANRPLRLDGTLLYLDRYWRLEARVGVDLLARAGQAAAGVDEELLALGLGRYFGGPEPDLQRAAAAVAVRSRLAVVAGGPGTGKTTTVARILALLHEQAAAAGRRPPRVALAAPTAKAAARLEEAVRTEAASMPVDETVRARLTALPASTLHRLLGYRPDNRSRFRHHRHNRLPHDVVVVDETSMVSLSLMAKLVEAVRTDARLVLVGDPDQLASVEAGAVLGDIVGPAADESVSSPLKDGIVVLRRVYRFGGAIAALAAAIQRGDADAAIQALGGGGTDLSWIAVDVAEDADSALGPVRARVVDAGRRINEAASAGDASAALEAMRAMRVLCAHRRGPYGVAEWTGHVERWLAAAIDGYAVAGQWYVGRPLLVTANDYTLRLYNGDTGVVVDRGEGRAVAVFERAGGAVGGEPTAARLGRHRARHDDPQEPGLAVRRRRRDPPRRRITDPHPRAALHGGDPGPDATSSSSGRRRASGRRWDARSHGPADCAAGSGGDPAQRTVRRSRWAGCRASSWRRRVAHATGFATGATG